MGWCPSPSYPGAFWPHRTLNAAIYCAPVSSILAGQRGNGQVADRRNRVYGFEGWGYRPLRGLLAGDRRSNRLRRQQWLALGTRLSPGREAGDEGSSAAGSHLPLTGGSWAQADPCSSGRQMSRIRRRVRTLVNPVSTAATKWWCHSAMRHMLTGYGPTARQRPFIRGGMTQGSGSTPSAEQMKARAAAIDQLRDRDDHEK